MDVPIKIVIIPLIAMSIGWFTNYIAIKMLFHPRKPFKALGMTLHGVFPKRQNELAIKLGELFASQLNIQEKLESTVKELFTKEETLIKLKEKMKEIGTAFIQEDLPMLMAFVTPQLFDALSSRFSKELVSYLEVEFSPNTGIFKSSFDVKSLVAKEIEALNSSELEGLLDNLLKKEFKFIEYSGAVLGFLIGLIQVAIYYYL